MKLRNKNTGEIVDAWSFYDGNETINLKYFTDDGQVNLEYRSLAELNEDWEDYKPVEPLIEVEDDPERAEKIRKAVRTWAGVLHIDQDNIKISIGSHRTSIIGWQPGLIGGYTIDFPNIFKELRDGMHTTITELCGEEEE